MKCKIGQTLLINLNEIDLEIARYPFEGIITGGDVERLEYGHVIPSGLQDKRDQLEALLQSHVSECNICE